MGLKHGTPLAHGFKKHPVGAFGGSGGSGGDGGDGGRRPGGCGAPGRRGGAGGGLGDGITTEGLLTEATPAPLIPRRVAARSTAPEATAVLITLEAAAPRSVKEVPAAADPRNGTAMAALKLSFGDFTTIADAGRPVSCATTEANCPVGFLMEAEMSLETVLNGSDSSTSTAR